MSSDKEKWKTYKNVFDNFAILSLEKLRSEGHYDEMKSPISIGKEANIFTATKGDETVLVKIYRLETCDFNRLYDYIKDDVRFLSLKKNKRKILLAWTQREFRNLFKARQGNVSVPKPIAYKNNILIEEFIGHDGQPSPQLRKLLPDDPEDFYKKTIENMRKLHKTGLVHGDLSEYNILNHDNTPVLIDFSQCTLLESANSRMLFDRDIKNIVRVFSKMGVKCSEEELKKYLLKK
jgi:RIO kinase 1